jgi:hypothetical protein
MSGDRQERWDDQLDSESSAGKLDFLFNEAESESVKGLLREWPQGETRERAERPIRCRCNG